VSTSSPTTSEVSTQLAAAGAAPFTSFSAGAKSFALVADSEALATASASSTATTANSSAGSIFDSEGDDFKDGYGDGNGGVVTTTTSKESNIRSFLTIARKDTAVQLLNHYNINDPATTTESNRVTEEITAELIFTFTDPITSNYSSCKTKFVFFVGVDGLLRGDKSKEAAEHDENLEVSQDSTYSQPRSKLQSTVHTNVLQANVYRGVITYKNLIYSIQILGEIDLTLLSITQASTSYSVRFFMLREHFDRSFNMKKLFRSVMDIVEAHPMLAVIFWPNRDLTTHSNHINHNNSQRNHNSISNSSNNSTSSKMNSSEIDTKHQHQARPHTRKPHHDHNMFGGEHSQIYKIKRFIFPFSYPF
jgi:hypothetical protein